MKRSELRIEKASKQNFGLSEAQFVQLLAELQKGKEVLFEQVFLTHFEDCLQYIKRKYQTNREDAYDATMDTLLQFRKRLIQGKVAYGNMRFLFTQMAGQVYLKALKKRGNRSNIEGLNLVEIAEINMDTDMMQALDKAWLDLCEKCRALLKSFYYDDFALKKLTTLLQHSSEAATRKQKQRCVEKLRKVFFIHYETN